MDGVRVLSPESIEQARTERASGPDAAIYGWPTRFGLGFSLPPEGAGFGSSSATAFGCPGGGGPIGFADPGAHVGFGCTMNQIQAAIPPAPRALRIIDAPQLRWYGSAASGRYKRQIAARFAAGTAWQDNDLVFCKDDGTLWKPDHVSRQFKVVEGEGS